MRARRLLATPHQSSTPQAWLLGSSLFSAQLASELGLPYSYAHHFSTGHTGEAVAAYRSAFQPSAALAEPYVMMSTSVIIADTAAEAFHLAGPSRVMALSLRTDRPLGPIVSPDDVATRLHTLEALAELWPGLGAGPLDGGGLS
jgi:alkanesulfonate monooxygenase SsuD/methylene tetrahydromethanopterin reductase-like flavin-dependent oxidoreductase (luciferase family)